MQVLISLVWVFIAHFHDGATESLEILRDMNMEPGDIMINSLQIQDESRKTHVEYRLSELQLTKRKIIRHCREKKQEKNLDKEGRTYEAGGF